MFAIYYILFDHTFICFLFYGFFLVYIYYCQLMVKNNFFTRNINLRWRITNRNLKPASVSPKSIPMFGGEMRMLMLRFSSDEELDGEELKDIIQISASDLDTGEPLFVNNEELFKADLSTQSGNVIELIVDKYGKIYLPFIYFCNLNDTLGKKIVIVF